MPLEIATERPGLLLRQFGPEDARALFELVDRNRPHLSQYLDETAAKYPDYDSVLRSIVTPTQPEKLRFGVWDGCVLVGTVNLDPVRQFAKLGYWIGSEYTGRGYATAAAQALCAYAFREFKMGLLVAFVHKDNLVSQSVLRRCGFRGGIKVSETALAFRNTPSI